MSNLKQRAIQLVKDMKADPTLGNFHIVTEMAKNVFRMWPDKDTENEMFAVMNTNSEYKASSVSTAGKQPTQMREYQGKKKVTSSEPLPQAAPLMRETAQSQSVVDVVETKPLEYVPTENKEVDLALIATFDNNALVEHFGSVEGVFEFAKGLDIKGIDAKTSILKLNAQIKKKIKEII